MSGAAEGDVAGAPGRDAPGTCNRCGAGGKLSVCSKCHSTRYCGPDCQKEDWKEHKKVCPQLAKEYAEQKHLDVLKKVKEGRVGGALKSVQKALQVQRESSDMDVVRDLLMESTFIVKQGRLDEGMGKLTEGLEISRKVCGDDHAQTADFLASMGATFRQQGKFDRAHAVLGEALRIQTQGDFLAAASTYDIMGTVHQDQGKLEEAAECFSKAVSVQKKWIADRPGEENVGAHFISRTATLDRLAAVHLERRQYPKALECHEEVLRITKQWLGPRHTEVGSVLSYIAKVYREQGNGTEALKHLRESLQIHRENNYQHGACDALEGIAIMTAEQGRSEDALQLFEETLGLQKRLLGNQDPNVAVTLINIARLHKGQGKFSEALRGLNEALRIQKSALSPGDPRIAATRRFIAAVPSGRQGR